MPTKAPDAKAAVSQTSNLRTAIFIDLENLTGTEDPLSPRGFVVDYCNVNLAAMITTLGGKKAIATAAAYASIPVSKPAGSIVRDLRQLSISLHDVPGYRPLNSDATMKDAADFQIYVDAMQLATTRPDIGTFVIVSRDNGYYALANRLKELGKTVVVAVPRGSGISRIYWDRVDRVLYLEPTVEQPDETEDSDVADTPILQPQGGILREIGAIPVDADVFGPETRWDYCARITALFEGDLGAVVQAHGPIGLPWADARGSLTHLLPGGSPNKVGFKKWITMMRFALPKDYAIVTGDQSDDLFVVHADDADGRTITPPLSLNDLGEFPELNKAINISAPIDKVACVVEWCDQTDGELTASKCYAFMQDDAGKGGLQYRDILRSLVTLASLELLHPLTVASDCDAGGVIARGANRAPETASDGDLGAEKSYTKSADYSEIVALQRIVAAVTERAAALKWPLGTNTVAALAAMKQRIDDLEEESGTVRPRGASYRPSALGHTWDTLPDL